MKNIQTFIIGLLAILIVGAGAANAATWTVTKAANSNDGACSADCSLREAVAAAVTGDTVVFDSNLVGQTFTLGGSEIVVAGKRITIDGLTNNSSVTVSGSDTSRIFHIQTGAALTLKNMTLRGGNGKQFDGEPGDSSGGAIRGELNAALSLDRVAFRDNRAIFSGAVHLSGGTQRITNSSFSNNYAESNSAIALFSGATLFMSNTTLSGNYTYDDDPQTFGAGAIALINANLIMRNSTVANNLGRKGGGISATPTLTGNSIDIGNSIVAGNAAEIGQDVLFTPNTTIISRGGNLIQNLETVPAGTFTAPNDVTGVNPLLAPLDFYGGFPVLSHRLQAGSPAGNGGLNHNAVDPQTNQFLTTDARGAGFPRFADVQVDKGAFEVQSGETSLVVTKKTNSNDNVCDTDCSLREAVYQASVNPGTDTITFAPNVVGTLTLGGEQIEIQNQNVNIVGYPNLNAETLIISGGNTNRIFNLFSATVKMTGMTLANGNAGGVGNASAGAIFANNSHLTLDRMIVRNNFAAYIGTIHIFAGSAHITNSTISNNSAKMGLALGVFGTLNMANTTVSGNVDADGGDGFGAVFVNGTANIRNSTIAFNRLIGGLGGGIYMKGDLNIGNSIVAGNIAPGAPDIYLENGAITSTGGNLVQNTNGFPAGTFAQTNDATGVDPLLGALADNGGSVTTHLLQPGSPAINGGVNQNAVDSFDNSALLFDARGNVSRILNAIVDKGAFEASAPTAATVSVAGRVTNGERGVARARVEMVDQNGVTRTAQTDRQGYFRFEEAASGATYVFGVTAKNLQFQPRVVIVFEQIDDLNLAAAEGGW